MMPGRRVRLPVFGEQGEEVLPGVGGDRTFALAAGVASSEVRQWMRMGLRAAAAMLELGDEGGLLGGDVGVFDVVVVEADFADGDAAGVARRGRRVGRGLRGWRCAASWGWMPALA